MNSVRFDAAADSLRRTSGDLLDYGKPYTVIFPINYSGSGHDSFRNAFVVTDGNNGYDQFYATSSHGARIFVNNTGSDTYTLAQNVWYWLACVRSSVTVAKMYIGNAAGDLLSMLSLTHGDMSSRAAATRMEFGGNVWSEWINAAFGPQFVWQRELTEDEIRAQFGRDEPVVDGVWGYYPVKPGAIIRDHSGNGRHHTVGGTLTEEAGPPIIGSPRPILIVGLPAVSGVDLLEIVGESIDLVDVGRRTASFTRRIADLIQASEAAVTAKALTRQIMSVMGIAETEHRFRSMIRRFAEIAGLFEQSLRFRHRMRFAVEAVDISDAPRRLKGMNRFMAETLGIAGSSLFRRSLARIAGNPISLSETLARARALARMVGESTGIAEAGRFRRALARIANQAIGVTESGLDVLATIGLELVRIINEASSLSEGSRRLAALLRNVRETIGAGETKGRFRAMVRTSLDAVQGSETALRARTLARRIGDAISLTETGLFRRTMTRIAGHAVGIAEAGLDVLVSISEELVRIANETLGIVEAKTRITGLLQWVMDSVAVTESRARARALARMATEGIQANETIIRARALVRRVAGMVGLDEAAGRLRSMTHRVIEVLQVTERVTDWLGSLLEALTAFANESLRIDEAAHRSSAMLRWLTENAGIGESFRRVRGLHRAIGEQMAVADASRNVLGGIVTELRNNFKGMWRAFFKRMG